MPIAGRPFRQERDTSLQVMIMGLSGRVVMWEVSARTPEPAGFHKEVPAAKAEAAAERTFPCRTTEIYWKQRKTPGYLRYLSCRRNCSKYLRSNRSRTPGQHNVCVHFTVARI